MSLACVIRIKGFINSYIRAYIHAQTHSTQIYMILYNMCMYICVRTTISRRECWLLLRPRSNPSTSFPAYYSARTMPFYFTLFRFPHLPYPSLNTDIIFFRTRRTEAPTYIIYTHARIIMIYVYIYIQTYNVM